MPAFAIPTEMVSSSIIDSELPSDNTSSPEESSIGTNDTICRNCSSPLILRSLPTGNASSSFDVWTIPLIISGLVIMAYVFYLAFANTSEEKGNKSEKASEDLPERISSTSISNTSISEYTIPQHENSFPTSKLAPVSPEVAAYEMRISNYEKSIDGYKKSISQYERWMSLYRTSETQYDITIDSYRTALTKFESSNKDLRAKLAEIRTAEQERTTHLAELGHRLEELGIDEDELLRKCGMTPRPKKIDADALVRRVIAEAFRT